jgi:spore maturation protein A
MKVLGRAAVWLLNINTIWGLLILLAFSLCVVQHYLPTRTWMRVDALRAGSNRLTIRLIDKDKQARDHDFNVHWADGAGRIEAADAARSPGRPWLITLRRSGESAVLRWDARAYGRYDLLVDGRVVAAGRLVTLQALTDAAFEYARSGFDIALGLVASMVLFLGLMKVGEAAGIVLLLARIVHPLIRLLFPSVPRDHPASGAILMNITTSLLGLGNAATPFGLKAMKELQALNPHPRVATDAQVMLLGWNTAGLALLPTTLIALRQSAGCSDPFEIIGACLAAGAASTLVAILSVRLLARIPAFSAASAAAEAEREEPAQAPADAKRGAEGDA